MLNMEIDCGVNVKSCLQTRVFIKQPCFDGGVSERLRTAVAHTQPHETEGKIQVFRSPRHHRKG